MQKAPVAVHRRSACSGVKALRNTSDARRQAAKLCYRFGPLTPSARSANLIAGDGTKNGFPAPNKEPSKNQNDYLTGKPHTGSNPVPFVRLKNHHAISIGYGRLATHFFRVSHFSVRVSVHKAYRGQLRQGACDWPFLCTVGPPPTL